MRSAGERVLVSPEQSMQEVIARDILVAEVRAWARRIGVEKRIREIHIRHMKRKWASVSTRGRLTLNIELFSQPPNFRKEVIVHELVHLKLRHGAHNKLFKSLIRAYLAEFVSFSSSISNRID